MLDTHSITKVISDDLAGDRKFLLLFDHPGFGDSERLSLVWDHTTSIVCRAEIGKPPGWDSA